MCSSHAAGTSTSANITATSTSTSSTSTSTSTAQRWQRWLTRLTTTTHSLRPVIHNDLQCLKYLHKIFVPRPARRLECHVVVLLEDIPAM